MNPSFTRSMAAKRSLLSAVIASALLLAGCGEAPQISAPAPVVKPALTEIVASQRASDLTFNGVVRAAQRADLAFRISGRLTDIAVKEGDQVKKGQLLASLDSRDAKTALEAAQLELKTPNKSTAAPKPFLRKPKPFLKPSWIKSPIATTLPKTAWKRPNANWSTPKSPPRLMASSVKKPSRILLKCKPIK